MISKIKGKIIEESLDFIVVEVGGLGYKVFISGNTISKLKVDQGVELFTYLVVRENVLDLYGFLTKQELDFFELLISVSGIGPKGALSVLSQASPAQLMSSISSGDFSLLTKVSGIGEKIAQRVVLELKNKIKKVSSLKSVRKREGKQDLEGISALIALGYGEKEATEAILGVDSKIKSTEEKVKAALKAMAK